MASDQLIEALADGRFHSGEELATRAGVTRGAVWKRVARLAELGIDVERVPGRGYRIAGGLELLDAAAVRRALGPAASRRVASLEVLRTIASTNTHLVERADVGGCSVCLAEHQSAGRGRLGRRWVSPFGANLYASLAWTFEALPAGVQALGLAAGAAVAAALDPDGSAGVALKWPNDLVARDRKLGGLLVELRGEPPGRTRAVVGVGINLRMPAAAAAGIDQPWIDLCSLRDELPARSLLAAAVIDRLVEMLERFAAGGFAAVRDDWCDRDALLGRCVEARGAGIALTGTARGIDDDGALLLESGGVVHRMVSAEISVRGIA
jgi:BirA family biotin operon repressor/biotin-[acetyl-CoA-carboxylase] ligase